MDYTKQLAKAAIAYNAYVESDYEDHMTFRYFASLYYGIPEQVADNYWREVNNE